MLLVPFIIILILVIFPNFFAKNLPSNDTPDFHPTHSFLTTDGLRLSGYFDQSIETVQPLWIYTENATVTIYNKHQTWSFNHLENVPLFIHSPGTQWNMVQTTLEKNEIITFDIHSYYGEHQYAANRLVENLIVGDGSVLYRQLLDSIDFFDLILIFAMFAGVIFFVEGSVYLSMGMRRDGSRIALFGFYCLSGTLWCVTDALYPYLTLLISPPWMVNILDTLGLLLFPIALTTMILFYINQPYTKRIIKSVLFLEIMIACYCVLMQALGISDLYQQQIFLSFSPLIATAFAMICIVYELIRKRDRFLFLVIFTVLPVFISNIVDGINIVYPFMARRVIMRHGFALSALMLVLQLFVYAKLELDKEKALKHLEKEVEESRISITLSQIQPHFLYNSLSGIKQLTEVNPELASEALEHFSYYLRRNLDSLVNKGFIPFTRELEHVKDYLYLETMRFPNKIHVDLQCNYTEFELPPLTVQTLAENAVRYGITKKVGSGHLLIKTIKTIDKIVIIIQDDGIGFNPHILKEDGRTHTGIENVRKRIELQCQGTLTVKSDINIGTTITITIPLKE